ncbi:hypothetical protein DICVIV_11300 [Dictyocaulus viviparus]|uniref:Uncharacterized protein n=1 Tax=Dictyocaulus viviparus TaxID=29172 RepID=A0A0D8XG82_DICVI|nr:hypothetical protein DICVIV_11300 [Dictyocaulus viviparus]
MSNYFYSHPIFSFLAFGCSEEWFLSPTYACHHFPLGLLFKELYVCMREPRDCRRRPIVLLRNLLAKHSYDKRYADMNSQRRIAILYLPLIHFAMDYINELESVITDSGNAYTLGVVTSSAPFLRSSDGCKNTFPSSNFTLSERLNQEEVQDILISVLYVIHRVPKRILGALCVEAKQNSLPQFFRLLEVTLEAFRYREGILRTSSERRQSYLKSHGESGRHKVALSGEGHSNNEENGPLSIHFRSLQLLNMSQEVALIVLEVSLSLAHTFADRQMGSLILESQTFSKLFSIHLSLLEECWPESVRLHCFYALSLLINMFRVHLFEEGPLDELSNLIERVLVALASRISTVQHAAAALLHLVLRHGFDAVQAYLAGKEILRSVSTRETLASEYTFVEKLGRSGCQTTVALARLLGVFLTSL